MNITQTVVEDVLQITVSGRLDGYWADYLDRVLGDALREGHHRVTVDCDGLVFLSSAGIAILVKFHKELKRISGGLQVVRPSAPVRATLKMTRLDALLVAPLPADVSTPAPTASARQFQRDGADFDVYVLPSRGPMTCKVVGHMLPLGPDAANDLTCVSLESLAPTFAIGIGAFGESVQDCRGRFGELVSVSGATAYQPADGTNVPDYLVAAGALASSVHVLGCLACEGAFSHLVRFDTLASGTTIGLSRVIDACFAASEADAVGVCAVVEAAGLVGAALRRSPVEGFSDGDFFAHPGVRTRLAFTAEPAFTGSVALIAGIATRPGGSGGHDTQLRPIGPNAIGHLHAAAFAFRPITKGPIEIGPTVSTLFEPDRLRGVLHLLHDDRAAAGAGESQCFRGACWVGPLASEWQVVANTSC
jgi:anti-anti-sigma factor